MESKTSETKPKKDYQDRKLFYLEDDPKKPISAAGVLLLKNNNEILMQKIPKEDSYILSDFGGKVDLTDVTVIETISRELSEEINCGIFSKETKKYLNQLTLMEMIEENTIFKSYAPNCKYLTLFVKFDENLYSLDMKKIGTKEEHDGIEREVQWIKSEDFIEAHFNHNLHPRLWGKNNLEFLGYQKPKETEEIKKTIKKFAFK